MNRSHMMTFALASVLAFSSGCTSIYYNTMESMGVHKRDILVDRVKEARDSQKDAKVQFANALEQFRSVVKFDGGSLEATYNKLNKELEKSEAQAASVRNHIKSVEDVSEALFSEWRKEIGQYSSDSLKKASKEKYNQTQARYKQLIAAMRNAEAKMEPVLVPLRDQVLFLKHNLNAKAISSLEGELNMIRGNVDKLIADMESSIAEADKFIATMQLE